MRIVMRSVASVCLSVLFVILTFKSLDLETAFWCGGIHLQNI